MAENRWYLAVQGNRIGPLPDDQLQDLVKEGKLEPETLVWRKGLGAWQPAREVPEMQALLGASAAATAGAAAPGASSDSASPVSTGWFVAEGGTKLGPLAYDRLESLAREGRIELDTFVWRKGMSEWKPARDVSEMAALLAARQAATPAPSDAGPAKSPEAPAASKPEPAKAKPASAESATCWYIAHGGDRLGPFSEKELPGLQADGKLTPDTLVWRKGMGAWKPALDVPEVKDLLTETPAASSDTAWEAESEGSEEPESPAGAGTDGGEGAAVDAIVKRITESPAADGGGTPAPGEAPESGPEASPASEEGEATTEPEQEPAPEPAEEPVTQMEGVADDSKVVAPDPEPVPEEPVADEAPAPSGDNAKASGASGPRPAAEVLDQQAEAGEEPDEEWAPVTPTAPAAPAKPVAAPRPPEKQAPEKPRKKASVLILMVLAAASLLVCVLPLYGAYVHAVRGIQPNPFTPALPAWGADLALWGIMVFLPFLGVLTALFAPFRVRWAHVGQLAFWLLAGAGLGTAMGMQFEALSQAVQDLFKQAQADFAKAPAMVEAFQWCEQQSVSRLPFLWIAAAAAVAIAGLGVLYLLWLYPRVKWSPLAKAPAPPSGRKGATKTATLIPAPQAKEGFSASRALCRLVFLGWVFLFLPWWALNELVAAFAWSDQFVVPTGRAFGMAMPVGKLTTFLHILPVLAVIGMGMVLPRWRPYRGALRTARLLGLLSLVLFVLTCGLLPANHLMQRKQRPPAVPETSAEPETPDATPPPATPETPAPPVGLTPAQAEVKREADAKVQQATELIRDLQTGVKAGSAGLKPKADRVDGLLGESIGLYEKIQVELDGAGTPIPVVLLHDLKKATEARKALRMLRGEMK